MTSTGRATPELNMILGLGMITACLVDFIGIGLGIFAAADRSSKKVYPVLGLILNLLVVALFAALLVIGLSMKACLIRQRVPSRRPVISMPDGRPRSRSTKDLPPCPRWTLPSPCRRAGSLPAHAPVREVRSELGPWGFWGSLGWGLFAAATGIVVVFIYMSSGC